MNCLEKYRSTLLKKTNLNLRILLDKPEEDSVHDFRVGVKRLSALYYFLHEIEPTLNAKKILKPYRSLFKSIGKVRDGHIAMHLIQELHEGDVKDSEILLKAVKSRVRKDFRSFQNRFQSDVQNSITIPTIIATGISERIILRRKQTVLEDLLSQFTSHQERDSSERWHKKRILLKRYHHTLDAFQFCPGHTLDEMELKQIKMLEQLLGDWHDRVTTIQFMQSLEGLEYQAEHVIVKMENQDRILLESAKIYLNKYLKWHENH
jgi:CHAD domain-containing protein